MKKTPKPSDVICEHSLIENMQNMPLFDSLSTKSDYVINGWPLRLRIGLIIQVMVSEMARCLKIKDEDDAQGN